MAGKPIVTPDDLRGDLECLYSILPTDIKELQSYDDTMYYFRSGSNEYIAKYYNVNLITPPDLTRIVEVLLYLCDKGLNVPEPVKSTESGYVSEVKRAGGYLVVFHYIAGSQLLFDKRSSAFWYNLGRFTAEISLAMKEVKTGDFNRHHPWDPLKADKTLTENQDYFPADKLPKIDLKTVISSIRGLKNRLKDYPAQFVHSDINEYNTVIGSSGELGFIDFNDMIRSYRVVDIAHCLGYIIQSQQGDLKVGSSIYSGYSSLISLTPVETDTIYDIIIARCTLSVTLGSKSISEGNQDNDYVVKCVNGIIRFLQEFVEKEEFDKCVLNLSS